MGHPPAHITARMRQTSLWSSRAGCFLPLLGLAAGLALAGGTPALPDDPLVADYLARRPVRLLAPLEADTARRVRERLIAALGERLGPVTGYKAALTNPRTQARFGVREPLLGVLMAGMLHPDGARLPATFGARPMGECDLIVRVGSAAINGASDEAGLLAALDAVIPFLELPDLAYAAGAPVDARALSAINAGARAGIVGRPIPVLAADRGWHERLATFECTLTDGTGRVLGKGTGADLMGHPLRVVAWLRDRLAAEGVRLAPGDLLSLGSLTPLAPVRRGQGLVATWRGLAADGAVSVRVDFD